MDVTYFEITTNTNCFSENLNIQTFLEFMVKV